MEVMEAGAALACRCGLRQLYHKKPANEPVPLHLAPMVRACTLPFRLQALRNGALLVWSEELIALKLQHCNRVLHAETRFVSFLDPHGATVLCISPEEKGRLIVQIGAGDPVSAAKAASVVAGDCAGIDLNCGCPKPFSVANGGGMGSRLLVDPDRLIAILLAIKEAVKDKNIPVSAKIRVLDTWEATESLLRRLVLEARVDCVSLHCRHVSDTPLDTGHWDVFKKVVETVNAASREGGRRCPTPVIGNGDIFNKEDAAFVLKSSQVDEAAATMIPADTGSKEDGHHHHSPPFTSLAGLMLARGALVNPRIFSAFKVEPTASTSESSSSSDDGKAALDLIRSNCFDYLACCEEVAAATTDSISNSSSSSSGAGAMPSATTTTVIKGHEKFTLMQMLKENGLQHYPMPVLQAKTCDEMRKALTLMFDEAISGTAAWIPKGQKPKTVTTKAVASSDGSVTSWKGKTVQKDSGVGGGHFKGPICRCLSALSKVNASINVPAASSSSSSSSSSTTADEQVLALSPFELCPKVAAAAKQATTAAAAESAASSGAGADAISAVEGQGQDKKQKNQSEQEEESGEEREAMAGSASSIALPPAAKRARMDQEEGSQQENQDG
jgi:tRNA-dihydrouridine synthase